MDAPALSVMIPTYNRAKLVSECVRSLQACGLRELEIIVIDDGSTDDTAEAVRAFGEGVIYLEQSNSGPAKARNLGFDRSRGRYVAFLDSDDAWLPGAPADAVAFLDAHPEVDVLFCEAQMGNLEQGYGSWIAMAGQQTFFDLPCRQETGYRILERRAFFERMLVRNAVFIGATIMRREAFEAAGRFDTELRGAADWELWLRMASRMTFAYREAPLAIYLRHDDCMSNDNDHMVHDFYLSLEKIGQKCPQLSASERRLLERQRRAHLYGYAYAAYDRGDYAAAKARFSQVLREGDAPARARWLWLASSLPFGMGKLARNVRWRLRGDERIKACGQSA